MLGECPVGIVEEADSEWIRLTHFDWLVGLFCGSTIALRVSDVRKIKWTEHWVDEGKVKVYDMDPLGSFQTRWGNEFRTEEVCGNSHPAAWAEPVSEGEKPPQRI